MDNDDFFKHVQNKGYYIIEEKSKGMILLK